MSNKMKRVALESSSHGVFEDSKAMLKHQTLLQDYQDLHKETDDIRHKLEYSKQRKLSLLAQVRFLRQRHKHLLQLKSSSYPQGQKPPNSEAYTKNRSKDQTISKNEAKLNKLPPLPGPKQNTRIQVAKEVVSKKTPDIRVNQKHKLTGRKDVLNDSVLGYNRKARAYSGKEVPSRKGASVFGLKQNDTLCSSNNAVIWCTTPAFDLNEDGGYSSKEASLPSRAPAFDLNEISMEKEELQVNFDRVTFEEPKRSLVHLSDDQLTDMNLLVCRNAGEGTSRVGKRKISWQDPVALRV